MAYLKANMSLSETTLPRKPFLLLRVLPDSLTVFLVASRSGKIIASARARESREPLAAIARVFSRAKITPSASKLGGVAAAMGEASFSEVRAAAVAGNAIAFALAVPAVGFLAGPREMEDIKKCLRLLPRAPRKSIIRPLYRAEPNITKSRQK